MRTILVILFVAITKTAAGADLSVERVFGPETPTGAYKHPACLTAIDNGDLYLVYYGGKGEYATDTAVFGSRKKKNATSWSAPVVVAKDPSRSVGNGVVWQAPDGLVWLFYVVRDGETWSTSRVQFKISHDRGENWSDASVLSNVPGTMVRNRPIVLNGGAVYLLPAYRETGNDPEAVGPDSTSVFFRYDPHSKNPAWVETGPIRSRNGNIQPAPAVVGGRVIAYCRRGGDYSPQTHGYIVRSESDDGGLTWSEGVDSPFPNPNAAVDLLTLRGAAAKPPGLMLVYNDCFVGRTPLTVAISYDRGKTFPKKRNLAEGVGDFGYPIALQTDDGTIHVVYTSDARTVVNHAVFRESWVNGK